ncbi:hypothetical protein ACQP0C_09540 [Nocardia sp. CA-129566]|uniref:hypothetical protein n=1 Tax=Nocardia sp. CA-129566 TaxID=3239976 RepID=UPI003D964BF7
MTDCENRAVNLDYLPRSCDHDLLLANQIMSSPLRHLLHLALGLSTESMDLLTALTDRLRTAEGALPDPATSGEF